MGRAGRRYRAHWSNATRPACFRGRDLHQNGQTVSSSIYWTASARRKAKPWSSRSDAAA